MKKHSNEGGNNQMIPNKRLQRKAENTTLINTVLQNKTLNI